MQKHLIGMNTAAIAEYHSTKKKKRNREWEKERYRMVKAGQLRERAWELDNLIYDIWLTGIKQAEETGLKRYAMIRNRLKGLLKLLKGAE
jgi:hypothetical protein